MKEIWKSIQGYEGLYEISNFGRVKSLAKIWFTNNAKREKPNTYMKAPDNGEGYPRLNLCKGGKSKGYMIHILVWDHFGSKKRDNHKLQVDHIDENRSNPRIDNLQLLTNRQNVSKGLLYNKTKYPIGVDLLKSTNRFRARIKLNGKQIHLGYFTTAIEASKAYQGELQLVGG